MTSALAVTQPGCGTLVGTGQIETGNRCAGMLQPHGHNAARLDVCAGPDLCSSQTIKNEPHGCSSHRLQTTTQQGAYCQQRRVARSAKLVALQPAAP
jgi:hypothetical protein